MEEREAIELIQYRVRELLNDEKIKKILIEKKQKENITNEEARNLVVFLAIATLYGI